MYLMLLSSPVRQFSSSTVVGVISCTHVSSSTRWGMCCREKKGHWVLLLRRVKASKKNDLQHQRRVKNDVSPCSFSCVSKGRMRTATRTRTSFTPSRVTRDGPFDSMVAGPREDPASYGLAAESERVWVRICYDAHAGRGWAIALTAVGVLSSRDQVAAPTVVTAKQKLHLSARKRIAASYRAFRSTIQKRACVSQASGCF